MGIAAPLLDTGPLHLRSRRRVVRHRPGVGTGGGISARPDARTWRLLDIAYERLGSIRARVLSRTQ